jgi:hypothetical protein
MSDKPKLDRGVGHLPPSNGSQVTSDGKTVQPVPHGIPGTLPGSPAASAPPSAKDTR